MLARSRTKHITHRKRKSVVEFDHSEAAMLHSTNRFPSLDQILKVLYNTHHR
jgi:hypothetical protein